MEVEDPAAHIDSDEEAPQPHVHELKSRYLFDAIEERNTDAIQAHAKDIDACLGRQQSQTPLTLAIQNHAQDSVEALLQGKAAASIFVQGSPVFISSSDRVPTWCTFYFRVCAYRTAARDTGVHAAHGG